MEHQPGQNVSEDPTLKLVEEFKRFVKDRGYTAEQMAHAYYSLLEGTDPDDKEEAVQVIYNEMRRMEEEQHVPVSHFARLIEMKQKHEDSPVAIYSHFVDDLEITDREKAVLHSVVDGLRSGEIECVTPDGGIVGSFRVSAKGMTKAELGFSVLAVLKELVDHVPEGKKYGFTFAED